jgi:hypothetical protein
LTYFVKVAAEVLTRFDEFKEQTLDILGPDSVDPHQIVDILSKVVGRTVKYVSIFISKIFRLYRDLGLVTTVRPHK